MAKPPPRRGPSIGTQLLLVVLGAALGMLALLLSQRSLLSPAAAVSSTDGAPPAPGGSIEIAKRLMERAEPSKTIYLNREGAALRGGPDDAGFNISSVVAGTPGNRAIIPPFAGTLARWNAIANCIRKKFASFDVRVVDQRPIQGDYVMAMLGGTPRDLGMHAKDGHKHSHATGLAPFNGEPIPRAVVFVFARALRENTRSTCEVASMEIAHAYGLDHARHCKDLMTYMRPCGARSFLDRDLACGEHEERPCADGSSGQNSYRKLLQVLGPAVVAAESPR